MASITIGQQPAARSTRVTFSIGENDYTVYPTRLDWTLERKAVPARCAWRSASGDPVAATAMITGARLRLRIEALDAPFDVNLITGLAADDVTIHYDGTPLIQAGKMVISEVGASGRARETARTTIELYADA